MPWTPASGPALSWPDHPPGRQALYVPPDFAPLPLEAGEVDPAVAAGQVAAPRPSPHTQSGQTLLGVDQGAGVGRRWLEWLEGPGVAPVGVGDRPVEHPEELPLVVTAAASRVRTRVVPARVLVGALDDDVEARDDVEVLAAEPGE